MRRLISALAFLVLAACADAPSTPSEPVLLMPEQETRVLSPNGSVTAISNGYGEIALSAGLFRGSTLARIELPSRMAWSPDSRRLFVNDAGNAVWSRFRLFDIDGGNGVEKPGIGQAAIAELERLNGCPEAPAADVSTHGMGWGENGRQVLVLVEGIRATGGCYWETADYIVVVADVRTGRILDVAQEREARRRFPQLPWAPL